MAMSGPVSIGTRGTVGSLLKKEMEYFRKLHSGGSDPTSHRREGSRNMKTTSGRALSGTANRWQKKKLPVPGICSIVDVAELSCCREDEASGFSYRILGGEFKGKQV
ncbi:hypothetical protein MLD38_016802 [Melastoma candidum]|uniref:Uncharacterized protein n=1 Tax=Melastoma candidum TaxID=119954 RepID=A0ACB9QNL6_9MYRT|nr:hypothetical protein MLD38_016802 [Melastoma candidum]